MAKLMGGAGSPRPGAPAPLITEDPLAGTEEILATSFYGRRADPEASVPALALAPPPARSRRAAGEERPKPTHYKVVCISLYTEDIERLERLVADLKGRGHTKANKSAVIRFALDAVDITKMPKGY